MCLGIPGRIVEMTNRAEHFALAEVDGVRREISLALFNDVDDLALDSAETVDVGDWVLIHVGFAMSKINEHEAAETLAALRLYGDPFASEMEEFRSVGEMDPFNFVPSPGDAVGPAHDLDGDAPWDTERVEVP